MGGGASMVERMAENCVDSAVAAPPLLLWNPRKVGAAGVISFTTSARATSVTVIGGAAGAGTLAGRPADRRTWPTYAESSDVTSTTGSCWYATFTDARTATTSRFRNFSNRRLGTISTVRFPSVTFNTMSASGEVYALLRQCVKTLVVVFGKSGSTASYAAAPIRLACNLSIL